MAMAGVLRPGHIQMRVLDIEEAVRFYRDVMGLVQTGEDASGRVYFKTWDERDHSSIIIRQSDTAGMDHLAFKVLDRTTLDRLESDLRVYGVNTERVPAGEMLETGERVRFEIPTGHLIELYADKTDVGNGRPYVNPVPWTSAAEHGIAPIRLDHALLLGPDLDGAVKLFKEVLGFYVVEHLVAEDGTTDVAVWLSTSMKAHDIAFLRYPKSGKIHHFSFLQESWEKVLRVADLMSMNGIPVDIGPTRHGITRGTTVYGFDPSGNRFENFCGGYQPYPDWKPIKWTWDEMGAGLLYHSRKVSEEVLSIVT